MLAVATTEPRKPPGRPAGEHIFGLTPKQYRFAQAMLEYGDERGKRREAAREAGYAGTDVDLTNRASRLLANQRVKDAIAYLQTAEQPLPSGHDVLRDLTTLAFHARSDRAQLNACKKLLALEEGAGSGQAEALATVAQLVGLGMALQIAEVHGADVTREEIRKLMEGAGMAVIDKMTALADPELLDDMEGDDE